MLLCTAWHWIHCQHGLATRKQLNIYLQTPPVYFITKHKKVAGAGRSDGAVMQNNVLLCHSNYAFRQQELKLAGGFPLGHPETVGMNHEGSCAVPRTTGNRRCKDQSVYFPARLSVARESSPRAGLAGAVTG